MISEIKNADRKVWCLFIFVIVLQIFILILANPIQCMSDAVSYVRLAKYAAEVGSIYPTEKDIYSLYLFAPGYVNWLTMFFSLGFQEKAALASNIFFNAMIYWEIYYIGVKFWHRRAAMVSVLLFSISITTYASMLCLLTEIMFTALAGLVICLSFSGNKKQMLIGGIILGLANWIRPLGIIYFVGIFIMKYLQIANIRHMKMMLAGFIGTAFIIGSVTYIHCGYFAFQSSTLGVNLIGSANDYARGNTSTGFKILQKGEMGYIPNDSMTFKEKDRYWRDLALKWIAEHPDKWLGLMPVKLARLHGVEVGFLDTFTGKDGVIQNPNYIMNIVNDFPKLDMLQTITLYNLIIYYFVLLLFFISAVQVIKKHDKGGMVLWGFWILGTLITLPFPCNSRYHFPYMMMVFLLAGMMLTRKSNNEKSFD